MSSTIKIKIAFLLLIPALALIITPATSSAAPGPSEASSAVDNKSTAGSTGQIEAKFGRAAEYLKNGEADKAVIELGELLPVAKSKGNRRQYVMALNLLGAIYSSAPVSATRDEESATNRSIRSMRGASTDRGSDMLSEALAMARELGDSKLTASVLNNLGTMQMSRGRKDKAAASYSESLRLSKETENRELTGATLVNLSRLHASHGEAADALIFLQESEKFWASMPDNLEKGEAFINIGQLYRKVAATYRESAESSRKTALKCFAGAKKIAAETKNERLFSFAIGYEAGIYEESGETGTALDLTRQALFKAQMIDSRELLYLWNWQIGRLLNIHGDTAGAAGAYMQAINALQTIRRSIRPEYAGSSLSFKDMIEPVYLGLVEILLKQSQAANEKDKIAGFLTNAREIIEKLRTAELQDYFKDSCMLSTPRNSDSPAGATAVLYLVTLPKSLEILASFPSGIRRYSTSIESGALELKARGFARNLTNHTSEYLDTSKALYNLIIRPLEKDLEQEKIEHIVFVPDSVLRSIPMSALNDGKEFIISRYSISSTLGMQLVNLSTPSVSRKQEILMAGISESVHEFPSLPNVKKELEGIGTLFDGVTLLNSGFKVEDLKREIVRKPYPYIHLATHGEFAGDMQNMYILAYDGLITFDLLDRLIKVTKYKSEPLELLTLSACKTAAGDDRAALGLAGIAVKAGAKSTMASLWEIDDKATSELILEFYRQLKKNGGGKAKALQQAQLKIMRDYGHPFFWSPFVLIGNWL